MMKIFLLIIGGIGVILLAAVIAEVNIIHHYDAGPPPISSSRAITLLNSCNRFIHVGTSARRAIAVTHVAKRTDSEVTVAVADVTWKWVSGPESKENSEKPGTAMFSWVAVGALSDWNFPESRWVLVHFESPDSNDITDCATPI
jgi:hypothetical protein